MTKTDMATEKLREAVDAQRANQNDKAEALYQEILSSDSELLDPKNGNDLLYANRLLADVHNNLGLIYFHRQDYRDAASHFRNALDHTPGNVEAFTNLSLVHQMKGNFHGAVEACEQALAVNADYVPAMRQLGRSLRMMGDLKRAEEVLSKVLEQDPQAEPLTEYGLVLAQLGRLDEALKSYQKAATLNADLPGLQINIANALFLMGRVQEAVECLQKEIEKKPTDPGVWTNMGMYLQKMGRAQEALRAYQESYRLNPRHLMNVRNYASILEQHGQWDGAWQIMEPVLAEHSMDVPLQLIAAKVETAKKQYDSAIARLEKVLYGEAIGHNGALVYKQLGKLYEATGKFEQAFKAFEFFNKMELEIPSHKHLDGTIPFDRLKELEDIKWDKYTKSDYKGRAPIFVMGFPMSGSGVLGTYFKSRDDVTVSDEVPLAESMAGVMTRKGLHYPSDLDKVDEAMAQEMRDEYWKNAEAYGDDGQKPLIDVFAFNTKDIALIVKVFPNARLFYVTRHPLELVFSCFSHDFAYNPITVNFATLDGTKEFYKALTHSWMRDCEKSGAEVNIIHFENLMTKEVAELKRVCSLAALPWRDNEYMEKMLAAGDATHRYPNFAPFMPNYRDELSDIISYMKYEG